MLSQATNHLAVVGRSQAHKQDCLYSAYPIQTRKLMMRQTECWELHEGMWRDTDYETQWPADRWSNCRNANWNPKEEIFNIVLFSFYMWNFFPGTRFATLLFAAFVYDRSLLVQKLLHYFVQLLFVTLFYWYTIYNITLFSFYLWSFFTNTQVAKVTVNSFSIIPPSGRNNRIRWKILYWNS